MKISVHSIIVFTTPKIWKHPKYSTNKKFGIYTMDYYSAIKKMSYGATKRHGKILNVLSERS